LRATAWAGGTILPGPVARQSFPLEEPHEVLGLACHPLGELAAARTHWAVRALAEATTTWGYIRPPVSKSTVHRWLSHAELKRHRIQRWLHSPDPEFRRKVRRVVRWCLRPARGTIHTTPAVHAWLAAAQTGRVRFEFLPVHASWLNQIEIWFSILERQALRRPSDANYNERARSLHLRLRAPLEPYGPPVPLNLQGLSLATVEWGRTLGTRH